MNEKIDKIYHELFDNPQVINQHKTVIEKYERNKDLFEVEKFKPETEIYKAVMRITSEYAMALMVNGNVRNAIPYLNKPIDLFDNHKAVSHIEKFKASYYESLYWFRRIANHEMKNF